MRVFEIYCFLNFNHLNQGSLNEAVNFLLFMKYTEKHLTIFVDFTIDFFLGE